MFARETMSAYQYHQALKKVKSGELFRLRPGVFANASVLADVMIDIDALVPGGGWMQAVLLRIVEESVVRA